MPLQGIARTSGSIPLSRQAPATAWNGVLSNGTSRATSPHEPSTVHAASYHVVPHIVDHVIIRGTPVPLYEVHHLQAMTVEAVRAHATHICTILGSSLQTPMPSSDHRLIEWITSLNSEELNPVRHRLAPHSVPHVYHQGVPIPLYEIHQLRSMETFHLRAHAMHIFKTIRTISTPIPEHDDLLLEWLISIHEVHLKEHLLRLQRGVETKGATQVVHAASHHIVPHSVQHVVIRGTPVPLYEVHHLEAMTVEAVRAHATHICTILGSSLQTPMPSSDHRLIEWIANVNSEELHPKRHRVVPYSVPHVYHQGVPIPLYEIHQLRSMETFHLRAHAMHIFKTIRTISKPVPEHDDHLLEWIIQIHELHLSDHLLRLRRGVETIGTTHVVHSPHEKTKIGTERIAKELVKLKNLPTLSDEDLCRVLMETLNEHGLSDTAAALRDECNLDPHKYPLAGTSHASMVLSLPPSMPAESREKFKETREKSAQQRELVQECAEQIVEQRSRMANLLLRVHESRKRCGVHAEAETQALLNLRELERQIEDLKMATSAIDVRAEEIKAAIEERSLEKDELQEAISVRSTTIDNLREQIEGMEGRFELLRTSYDGSELSQADRIKRILLSWDTPQGPQRIAAEMFAQVDSNHDGRLDWANDEVCKFVRLLFKHLKVNSPSWPDAVWYEIYRLCDVEQSLSVGVLESLRFARECFEAALRAIIGGLG